MTRPRFTRSAPGERRPRSGSAARRNGRPPGERKLRPYKKAVSAGGIVFRHGREGVEIVLVGRSRDGLWALPKGTPDGSESLEETALREVREETGLDVAIVCPVGEIRYRFREPDGTLVDKIVHHFLMAPVGGDTAQHDEEFDVVRWCHFSEAERLLTHRNQLPLLHRAMDLIATLPV